MLIRLAINLSKRISTLNFKLTSVRMLFQITRHLFSLSSSENPRSVIQSSTKRRDVLQGRAKFLTNFCAHERALTAKVLAGQNSKQRSIGHMFSSWNAARLAFEDPPVTATSFASDASLALDSVAPSCAHVHRCLSGQSPVKNWQNVSQSHVRVGRAVSENMTSSAPC